ncbi:MAG: hypothetical protein ANABAC_0696 [Anaerolineae bacterium]|jgi:hypothetical protein|nr:MAG: hypothetical protein ANABAC_0696 [Anaerolineae bacterium]
MVDVLPPLTGGEFGWDTLKPVWKGGGRGDPILSIVFALNAVYL